MMGHIVLIQERMVGLQYIDLMVIMTMTGRFGQKQA